MRRRTGRRRERGFSLILSLITMTVLSILMVATYRLANTVISESVYRQHLEQSHAIAEAGVEDALHQLYLTPGWTAGFTNKAFGAGKYTVTVVGGASPVVTSTGYSSAIAQVSAARTTVQATATFLTGASTTTANVCPNLSSSAKAFVGAAVNAYDSSVNTTPTTFVSGATVCSNSIVEVPVGQGSVNGDVYYGAAPAPSASAVTGTIHQSTFTTRTVPFHDGTAYVTANNNATMVPTTYYTAGTKQLNIPTGKTVTLAPGNYYLNTLTLNSGATLIANNTAGAVVIYLTGDLNLNGVFTNSSKIPSKLLIYPQTGINTNLQSTTPFYGVIEGPGALINDNMVVYGKLAGNSLSITAAFHYDLKTTSAGTATTHVGWLTSSWTENK